MAFEKVEHLGIAVHDLEKSIPLFEKITGMKCYKKEVVESEGVVTAFLSIGDTKVELLQSISEGSAIDKFLQRKGEGMHHIAFEVQDIQKEMNRLKEAGFTLLNEVPKEGADNKWICFIHPKETNGVLLELCQSR